MYPLFLNPLNNPVSPVRNTNDTLTRNVNDYSTYNGDWQQFLMDKYKAGDSASLDRILNYMMSESSSDRARNWTASREDTQIQRFVADAKAAGFNPYFLLTNGGQPVSSASHGNSYGGSYETTEKLGKSAIKAQMFSAMLNFIGNLVGGLSRFASIGLK